MRRWMTVAALLATLASCGPDARIDPARFASAATLDDALARASEAYGVPREVLAAVAWSESRFALPTPEAPHDDHVHGAVEVGPLHLRHGAPRGVDSLVRATALLGVDERALAAAPGLAVAGAAAVLAELGRATGARTGDVGSWTEALARYSGLDDRPQQVAYAAQVLRVLREGVTERAWSGETITVAAHRALPEVSELLTGANVAAQFSADYGPALWSAASSSNFTAGRGGNTVQYVVIHTMQGSYAGSISWFRNPAAMASAHYNVRSSDGQVTQMVSNGDTAWHAGNWYYNQRSVGIEHEGFVADPGRWYTDAMYRASARLTRALCDRYRIPIDRQHIIGHYQIPRSGSGAPCASTATNCGGSGAHYDPGNGGRGWDWDRFLALVRGGGTEPPPPPPPPAWGATLVRVNCPATARSGERPVAWVEYRNTGTTAWDNRNTRLGTTGPRDRRGTFFDMENWLTPNRPTAVDMATAPGATGRFSFVINIPSVSAETTLSDTYALVQEGANWFGPADDAVRCAVRVTPRAPADAGAPAADVVNPVEDVPAVNEDVPAVNEDVPAVGEDIPTVKEDVQAVNTDAGAPPADAGSDDWVEDDAGTGTGTEPVEGGCGCRTSGSQTPGTGSGALVMVGLVGVARRRRRRR